MPKNAKQRLRRKYERAEKFGRALCAVAGIRVHAAPGCVELIYPTEGPNRERTYTLQLVIKRPITERTWERAVKDLLK